MELKTKDFSHSCAALRAYHRHTYAVEKSRKSTARGHGWMVALSTALTLTACAPAWDGPMTLDQRPYVLDAPGGELAPILRQRAAMIAAGQRPVMCQPVASAHTSWLSIPGACVCADTPVNFHGAQQGHFGGWHRHGTEQLAATYAPALRSWFYGSGAAYLTGANFQTLYGSDLAAMGAAQLCDGVM